MGVVRESEEIGRRREMEEQRRKEPVVTLAHTHTYDWEEEGLVEEEREQGREIIGLHKLMSDNSSPYSHGKYFEIV